MDIGGHPLSITESLLRRIQFQTIVTRRTEIRPEDWQWEFYSPFWRVYVNERDGGYIECDGERMNLEARGVHVLPAWLPFRTGIERPIWQNYIHFDFLGFPHSLMKSVFAAPIRMAGNPLITQAAREWMRLLRVSGPSLPLVAAANTLVHAIMTRQLVALEDEQQKMFFVWLQSSIEIGPALERIDQRLGEPPSNEELARLCHSSVAHFSRKFHQAAGMSPARYGRERRVAVAAQMLHEKNRSIDEIAEATGFVDRFHFSRVFKTHLGFPPAAYRDARNTETAGG